MNNYCRHCGFKFENGEDVCPKCKVKVIKDRINVEQKKEEIKENKKTENIYFFVCLGFIFFTIGSYFVSFLNDLFPVLVLITVVLIIISKAKVKNSVKINVLYYLLLIGITSIILMAIISIVSWLKDLITSLNRGLY